MLYFRGNAYFDKRQYDQAIQDYDRAIKLKPSYVNAFINRGRAYRYKRQYDRAIEDFSQAIKLNPKNAQALSNRGNAYLAKREYRPRHRRLQPADQGLSKIPRRLQ